MHEGLHHNDKVKGCSSVNAKSDSSEWISRFVHDKLINGACVTSDFVHTRSLLKYSTFHIEGECLTEKNGNAHESDFVHGLFHWCGLCLRKIIDTPHWSTESDIRSSNEKEVKVAENFRWTGKGPNNYRMNLKTLDTIWPVSGLGLILCSTQFYNLVLSYVII